MAIVSLHLFILFFGFSIQLLALIFYDLTLPLPDCKAFVDTSLERLALLLLSLSSEDVNRTLPLKAFLRTELGLNIPRTLGPLSIHILLRVELREPIQYIHFICLFVNTHFFIYLDLRVPQLLFVHRTKTSVILLGQHLLMFMVFHLVAEALCISRQILIILRLVECNG